MARLSTTPNRLEELGLPMTDSSAAAADRCSADVVARLVTATAVGNGALCSVPVPTFLNFVAALPVSAWLLPECPSCFPSGPVL
eukprot:scaffold2264_cov43-Tisochrysis_lutea.AAC.2